MAIYKAYVIRGTRQQIEETTRSLIHGDAFGMILTKDNPAERGGGGERGFIFFTKHSDMDRMTFGTIKNLAGDTPIPASTNFAFGGSQVPHFGVIDYTASADSQETQTK